MYLWFLCLLVISVTDVGIKANGHQVRFSRDPSIGDRRRLVTALISKSAGLSMPGNATVALDVTLGMTIHYAQLNLKTETLTVVTWMSVQHQDKNLQWDPNSYGLLQEVSLPSKHIYEPDVTLYTSMSAEKTKIFRDPDWPVLVKHNGGVEAIISADFDTSCPIQFEDSGQMKKRQNCHMKFGSWTQDGYALNLIAGNITTTIFTDHRCLQLVNTTVERRVYNYECCPSPYIDVTFTLQFDLDLESDWCRKVYQVNESPKHRSIMFTIITVAVTCQGILLGA